MFMPVFDRQLAGDDRGSGVGAIVYHFQQIIPFALHQKRQAPVVKDVAGAKTRTGQGYNLARRRANRISNQHT